MDDDALIMQQLQRGQVDLFETLVLRYRLALVRVAASKLGDATLAEDVAQETLLAVYAARDSYDPQFSFRTWLWTILLNRCRRHLARDTHRRREVTASALKDWGGAAPEPVSFDTGLERLLAAERLTELHALLATLPEPQADALRLRFFGGLKFQEIADAMDCSLGGAKLRVRNGLLALAAALRGAEVADHDM
jgi:RNA polymerase sigma-70 factor (ECF subfamily)